MSNSKVFSIVLLALSAVLPLSCGGGGTVEDKPYCRVVDGNGNPVGSITSTAQGLTAELNVQALGMWQVASNASWAGVSPSRGNKYGKFTVTVLRNTGTSSREATVTVTCADTDPVTVKVVQEAGGGAVEQSRMRFMTFNIRTGGKSDGSTDEPGHEWATVRKDAVFKMFAEIDPDVAVLQECREEQLVNFEASLTGYDYFRYACDGVLKSGATESCTTNIFKNSGARNVIMLRKGMYTMLEWGRFWLSDTPSVVSTFPETESKKVTLWLKVREVSSGKEFYVFNIHFVTPGKGDCLLKCANCTVTQMKAILGSSTLPVFLAGDFNAIDTDTRIAPVPAYMKYARTDSPITDPSLTYNHFSASSSDWKRLDHIFYLNAKPTVYKVVNEAKYGTDFISDHWPVYCDFEI